MSSDLSSDLSTTTVKLRNVEAGLLKLWQDQGQKPVRIASGTLIALTTPERAPLVLAALAGLSADIPCRTVVALLHPTSGQGAHPPSYVVGAEIALRQHKSGHKTGPICGGIWPAAQAWPKPAAMAILLSIRA
jgi:hypothetical protein